MNDEKLHLIFDEVEEALGQHKETSCATQALVDTDFLARSISVLNFSEPIICDLDDSLHEASIKLQEFSVGCLIVEDSKGFIKGVFSERDFMTRVFDQSLDLHKTAVRTVMTAEPTTVYPDDTVAHCLSLMSLGGFRHLPIVDTESVPVGILSMQDVVRGITERIMAQCAN
jgi:CBS domain-containing protein